MQDTVQNTKPAQANGVKCTIVYELVKIWLIKCQMGTVFHIIHELGTQKRQSKTVDKVLLKVTEKQNTTLSHFLVI